MPAKGGLGRGLSALIPDQTRRVIEVEVTAIVPNPAQVRRHFDPVKLEGLAVSLRQHGLLQPLVVQEVSAGHYQLVVGERRWRAAQMAGLKRVPVVVREATPQEGAELALVENLQRADLNPLEEANAYRALVQKFGLTQEQVAVRVGRSPAAVSNALRLLNLPSQAQASLMREEISEGHARCLLGLPQGERVQLAVLGMWRKGGWSVRRAEALVQRLRAMSEAQALEALERLASERGEGPPSEGERDPETLAIERQFEEALGTRVSLLRRGSSGRLVVYFYSEEELQALYDLVRGR